MENLDDKSTNSHKDEVAALCSNNVKDNANNESQIRYGECTPQNASENRLIDNSIFNTISKIVNPATKVNVNIILLNKLTITPSLFDFNHLLQKFIHIRNFTCKLNFFWKPAPFSSQVLTVSNSLIQKK